MRHLKDFCDENQNKDEIESSPVIIAFQAWFVIFKCNFDYVELRYIRPE